MTGAISKIVHHLLKTVKIGKKSKVNFIYGPEEVTMSMFTITLMTNTIMDPGIDNHWMIATMNYMEATMTQTKILTNVNGTVLCLHVKSSMPSPALMPGFATTNVLLTTTAANFFKKMVPGKTASQWSWTHRFGQTLKVTFMSGPE